MANIKSTRSLHIQNDQTDAEGVYQRNSGADLFMEAPGGIQQFTNFNDKVASSNDDEAPANAFTKSPYYDSAESIFGSPGLSNYGTSTNTYTSLDQGQTLDYRLGKSRRNLFEESLATRTERSGAVPSDIKILDDIAVVSYRNHSQEVYIANTPVDNGFVVIKSIYEYDDVNALRGSWPHQQYILNVDGPETLISSETMSGVNFPDLGTSARSLTEFTGKTSYGDRRTVESNAGIDAGYNICFEGDVADLLKLGPTTTNESGACSGYAGDTWTWNFSPSEPGWTITSPGQCASNGCGSMPPAYDGTSDEQLGTGRCGVPAVVTPQCFNSTTGSDIRRISDSLSPRTACSESEYQAEIYSYHTHQSGGIFYNYIKAVGKTKTERSRAKKHLEKVDNEAHGLNINIERYPSPWANFAEKSAAMEEITLRNDAELLCEFRRYVEHPSKPYTDSLTGDTFWGYPSSHGSGTRRTCYHRVPVQTTSDSFFYKKGQVNRCGRVDIYERRKGSIIAVSGNKITITGPTGDGTYDTELLQDGDKIKIVSALNETPKDHIHPMNGVKYVKRTTLDTEYYIYDDENLTQETDTSGIRDVSGISWAHYGATQGSNGSWRFKETLFSPNGLNGDGSNIAQYVVAGESPKLVEIAGGHSAQNYDALDLLPEAYRFGQAIDIIKQPDTDHYWLAISEMGNTYSTQCGINYHGKYGWAQRPVRPENITAMHNDYLNPEASKEKTGPIPEYGYKFSPPVHEPYGRVWLYKVSTSSSAISSIDTPEEINASTTNPYINSPPFLDGDVDFEAFTDYRNLYWHRAMISNFIAEGEIGDLFDHGGEWPDADWKHLGYKMSPISSGSMYDGTFYYNRGKLSPFTMPGADTDSQLKAAEVWPGYSMDGIGIKEKRVQSSDFFLSKIAPYYRANNSQYGGYPHPIKTRSSAESKPPYPSTIDYHWLSTGYKFADGFGFNVCMKVDDVTNGSKPVIAISNTAFPYLSTVSKSTDSQLSELQKKVDKLERNGYKDPHTQDFIDRHTKTNQFISDFCASGKGSTLGNRYRRGSILIHNGNQSINLQTLDHTVRVNENLATLAYYPDYKEGNPMRASRVFTDWYGKPPTMMFRNGSLLVGTDEGRIKMFKEGSLSTSSYREAQQTEDVGLRRYKLLLSRFITVDGEDYLLEEGASEPGELIQSAGYQHFSDYDKRHNDEWVLGNESTKRASAANNWMAVSIGHTYKYAIEGWVWKREDLSAESVYYPLPAISASPYAPTVVGTETYTYLDYSTYYIDAEPDVLPGLIYPTAEGVDEFGVAVGRVGPGKKGKSGQTNIMSYVPGFSWEDQLSSEVESKDWENILLREPFGYTFRCDRQLLLAHGSSYTNEFDTKGSDIAHRLYLYEFNESNFANFTQKITAATADNAGGSFGDGAITVGGLAAGDVLDVNGTADYYKIFEEGSITFSEGLEGSKTIAYLMTNMYDIMSDKIALMTPFGHTVFRDVGLSKDYNFSSDERRVQSKPYFSFTEEFNAKYPYSLNKMYTYSGGLGTEYPTDVFDVNDEHNGLCAFYNVETNSSQDDSIRILKSVKFVVNVEENITLKGVDNFSISKVLPSLTFYRDDPRKTITQAIETVHSSVAEILKGGKKLLYGPNTAKRYSSPNNPLYVNGLQDSSALVKYPTYTRTSLAESQGWRGEITISGPELSVLTTSVPLIKNSSDNKVILNNNGDGDTSGSYVQEFDDINKNSFDSNIHVESTLIVGLMSHNTQTSDFDGTYRTKWVAGRKGVGTSDQDLNYIPYSKPFDVASNIHSFSNKAKISSVEFTYKDYSIKDLRRFQCAFFKAHPKETISGVEYPDTRTESIIRMGSSKTPAFFDEEGVVLNGTSSKSIQLIEFDGSPQQDGNSTYTISRRFDSLDVNSPDFLSLSISAFPKQSENFDMMLSGYLPASGLASTYIAGVVGHSDSMPLKMGAVEIEYYLGLSISSPLGFKCDGVSLFTPTAFGVSKSSSMSAQFPGGTGVNEGVSLAMGMPHSSKNMRLAMGQHALDSGNMSIAVSGVYGSYNSIPCIQGNLYLNSTYVDNNNAPLTIGRFTTSGTMPLRMGSPDPVSGVMNLAINTEPLNKRSSLYHRGYVESTGNTSLYIGTQVSEISAPLFLMQPHRIPFLDPQSPATYEEGDGSQIPALYVSGAAIPTANSLDNNFHHQKQMVQENSQFDYSSNAEAIISYNSSNSLSRNTLSPGNTADYGTKRISKVGKGLKNYNGLGTVDFYSNDLSRQAIDSNGTYLAIGTNTSTADEIAPLHIFDIASENSVSLSYIYNRFEKDLISLGTISSNDSLLLLYKDVKVSTKNRIAISTRAYVNADIYDMVFILEKATINDITTITTDFDECAIQPGNRFSTTVSSSEGWKITSAFTSDSWTDSSPSSDILNKAMGTSISWRGEDLYYDKQSARFGTVCARYELDDYAIENKEFGFNNTSDAVGYNNNINNIPEGTKTGFGVKIQVVGDFAFVGAPLLDPYIANNTLSAVNAASPDGAVYVFKYDGGWSYVDAIYSGGLISSAIAGVDSCAYDAKLFGYDLDYDSMSRYLSVGEPMSNTVYQFNINPAGTPSLLNSYSSTDSKFGTFVNSVSAGLITNTKSKIQDTVYSQDFEFSQEEIESEIQQYVSGVDLINSVFHEIVSVQRATFAGKEKLLVVRDFEVNYGAGDIKKIQKISLLNLHDLNGTLYISGPTPISDSISLNMLRPSGGSTGDLGITFGSIGTGVITPLHLEVASASSGIIPLHMRVGEEVKTSLYLKSEYSDVSSDTSLILEGPVHSSGSSVLYAQGKTGRDLSSSMFVLGGVTEGGMAQAALPMRVAQVDVYPVSGQQDVLITGLGHGIGDATAMPSLYLGAGDYGPASGTSFLRMEAPLSAEVSAFKGLAIITDPASGVSEAVATLMMPNTQTVEVNGVILKTSESLYMSSTAPSSGNKTLVMYREGVGGGQELDANTSLMMASITATSGINVYISGGYTSTDTASLAIPSGIGTSTKALELFMRGYSE